MAKLKEDIKRMLAALAYQDAGEYLSSLDKMKMIGYRDEGNPEQANTSRKMDKKLPASRIALIVDNSTSEASLNYIIDACQRQHAQVDLIIPGTGNTRKVKNIESRIAAAGIDYKTINTRANPVDGVIQYIFNQPGLIYLVAMSDDEFVQTLIENVLPERELRIPVPLVLINDDKFEVGEEQSVA